VNATDSRLAIDLLVIATDVDGVYIDGGSANQTKLGQVTPDELADLNLPAGSMGPKVQAACDFARNTGNEAVMGSLTDIVDIVVGTAGTRVRSAGAPDNGSSSSRSRRVAGKC
jgi:carbamate kinase